MRLPLLLRSSLIVVGTLLLALLGVLAQRPDDRPPVEVSVASSGPAAQPLAEVAPAAAAAPATAPDEATPATRAVADPTWVARTAGVTTVPARALQAYATATLVLADEQPGCRLGWTTLAAIGAVESRHGSHGGAVLDADGRVSAPVVGPGLDGSPGVAAIRDTDDGALDGDPLWDRAVGPLQFLPSTWRRWGEGDPQDVDDASLAAARYLCASGGDLRTAVAWQRAVLSYNRSSAYAATVLATADRYAAASLR